MPCGLVGESPILERKTRSFFHPPFFLYPTSTSLSIRLGAFAVMKRALWFPTGKSFRREDTGGVRGDLFCCSARKAHRSVAAGPPLWRGIGGARWALCFRSQEDELRSPREEGLSLGSGISHYPQKRPMFRPRRMRSMRRGQGPSGAGAGAGVHRGA